MKHGFTRIPKHCLYPCSIRVSSVTEKSRWLRRFRQLATQIPKIEWLVARSVRWKFSMYVLAEGRWPDAIDTAVTVTAFVIVVVVVVLGYVFMVLDYRAYLRSLRRALVRVANYLPHIPEWARVETPRCVATLGLRMPCTADDLLRAYRRRVKELHPDHGGDMRQFLILQQSFEEATAYVA